MIVDNRTIDNGERGIENERSSELTLAEIKKEPDH
jgi:hypothetical protein